MTAWLGISHAKLPQTVVFLCAKAQPTCFHQVYSLATGHPESELQDASVGQGRSQLNVLRAAVAKGCAEEEGARMQACVLKGFMRAADAGQAEGKLLMAEFMAGRNRAQEARKLMEEAARDIPLASAFLAMYQQIGFGGPEDPQGALKNYVIAGDGGDPEAQYFAGLFLLGDLGNQPDYAKAQEYLTRSAQAGWPDAQSKLARELDRGNRLKPDMAKAIYWYERAALGGNAQAMFHLGIIYMMGLNGSLRDSGRGIRLIEMAAKLDDTEAMYALGQFYVKGYGVFPDREKARAWIEKAARHGHPQAKRDLDASGLGSRSALDFWDALTVKGR